MLKKIFCSLITLYLAWLALVFVVVNPLVNIAVKTLYQQQTGRTLHYSLAQINPFTLSFYAYDLEDRRVDGSVFWSLDALRVDLSLSSLLEQGIVLDELLIRDLYLHGHRFKDGSSSITDILKYRSQLEPATEVDTGNVSDEELPGISIKKMALSIQHLGFTDYSKAEPFEARLAHINLSLSDFSTLHEVGKPYHFIAHGEAGGELEWNGTVSVLGKKSQGHLALRNISLLPLWRFKKDELNFDLLSARFSVGGDYALSWRDLSAPIFSIEKGFLSLDDFSIQAKSDEGSYLKWQSISFNDIALQLEQQSVDIKSLKIKELDSRLQINKDGSTNFTKMFAMNSLVNPQPSPEKDDTITDVESSPWHLTLGKIIFDNNRLDFSDLSLSSRFRVQIEQFSGEIGQVSTDTTVPSSIDLHGMVDGYAPVTLLGTATPLLEQPQLDVDFKLAHVDLSSVSPYSGDYAGWKIDKGLVSIELGYQLENNRLIGSNKVVIDQLKLGERVEGMRLVDLPLRLAVALMTDENGSMKLDVPVEGSMDDPSFKIGSILWQALRNVVMNVVSAPFKALASLFGSDVEELEYVIFLPGSIELTPSAKTGLDTVKQAIDKRPILRLGIEGRYDEELDTQYLKQQKFIVSLQAGGLKPEDVTQKNQQYNQAVNELFKKNFPAQWAVPEKDRPTITGQSRKLEEQLVVDKTELQQLARNRALAIKRYLLVDKGMDVSRVFIQLAKQDNVSSNAKLILEAE
jgi:hypothetical protein